MSIICNEQRLPMTNRRWGGAVIVMNNVYSSQIDLHPCSHCHKRRFITPTTWKKVHLLQIN